MDKEKEDFEVSGTAEAVAERVEQPEERPVDPHWAPVQEYLRDYFARLADKDKLAAEEEDRCQRLCKEAEERGYRPEYILDSRDQVASVKIFEGEQPIALIMLIDGGALIHIRSTVPFVGYETFYEYNQAGQVETTNWFGNTESTYEVDLNAYHQSGNPLAHFSPEALRDVAIKRFGVDPGEPPVIEKE